MMDEGWRKRKQTIFISLYIAVIFFAVTGGVVWYVMMRTQAPTCFDGIKNQDELDVDCGGVCAQVCPFEVTQPRVLWARAFHLGDFEYDVAAAIENPNRRYRLVYGSYTVEVYDDTGRVIKTIEGDLTINPRETFFLFEPRVTFSDEPAQVFVTLNEDTFVWERDTDYSLPRLSVENSRMMAPQGAPPRLLAEIVNEDVSSFSLVEAFATVYNEENNIVAVSRTVLRDMAPGERRSVFFHWPTTFREPPGICLTPVASVLAIDRSGSMNDDNDDPPEPISTAKAAAQSFVDFLGIKDAVGVVSFAKEGRVDTPAVIDKQKIKDVIGSIEILPEDETTFTNMGDGLYKARDAFLRGKEAVSGKKKSVVLLTDGRANYPKDPGGEEYAKEAARVLKEEGVDIFTIGLGEKVNNSFLRSAIASSPSQHFVSASPRELKEIYRVIAEEICPEKVYFNRIFVRVLD